MPQTFIDSNERDWFYQRQDLKDIEQLDTYEELAAEREAAEWERYDIWQESRDRQRGEALGDAAEDLGEGVGDFVKDLPVVRDTLGDAAEDIVDYMDDDSVGSPFKTSPLPETTLKTVSTTGKPPVTCGNDRGDELGMSE